MDVLMPQLGETVAEGKIVKWFKAAGDAVKPGDNLFEIETDKTSMEVPATSAGTLAAIAFGVRGTAQGGPGGGQNFWGGGSGCGPPGERPPNPRTRLLLPSPPLKLLRLLP